MKFDLIQCTEVTLFVFEILSRIVCRVEDTRNCEFLIDVLWKDKEHGVYLAKK